MGRSSRLERRKGGVKREKKKEVEPPRSRSRQGTHKKKVETKKKTKKEPPKKEKEKEKASSKSSNKKTTEGVSSASISPDNKTDDKRGEDEVDDLKSLAVTDRNPNCITTAADTNVEEQTFQVLKHYLESTELLEPLNEEEVANRMVKTNKIAMERARYQGNHQMLWENQSDCDDPDDELDFYREAHRQEEEFGLANDFFKHVVTDVNQQLKTKETQQPQQKQRPSSSSSSLAKLDKKTVNWLKRSLGLERSDDLWFLAVPSKHNTENVEYDSDHPTNNNDDLIEQRKVAARRLTRGVARSTRIKRRQERDMRDNIGLQGLLQAIDELEETHGPFERKKWGRHSSRSANDVKTFNKKGKENEFRGLVAHMPLEKPDNQQQAQRALRPRKNLDNYRVVRLVRISVGRKHVRPIRENGNKNKNNKNLDETGRKRKATQIEENDSLEGSPSSHHLQLPDLKRARLDNLYDVESDDEESLPEGRLFGSIHQSELLDFSSFRRSSKDPIPLRLLDWQRRQSSSRQEKTQRRPSMNLKAASARLPPILAEAGIQCLPKWEETNRRDAKNAAPRLDPPRRRYTDAEYAKRCAQLINALDGPARAWARYEFFYSDIDRAWYNRNEFAADVAKLGVRPDMRLTRREWSMIRRRIPNRPRLFSKRFIFSQLQKRNQYRETFRELQANPELPKKFDYEVTATIPVGATVTAFNKRVRVLHRGVVLFHDAKGQGYLVLFERKHLGYEFCPDTEVASHGVPKVLIKSPAAALDGSSLEPTIDHNSHPGNLPYGTLLQQPSRIHPTEDLSLPSKLMRLVAKPPSRKRAAVNQHLEESSSEMVRKVEEREILVRLLKTTENAIVRKRMILDAIEKCHELQDKEHPTTDRISKTPERLQQHYDWLLANLELTNKSLEASLVQMRIMYGKAYAAGQSRNQEQIEQNVFTVSKENLIRQVSSVDNTSRDLTVPWMFAVIMDCKDSGNKTASTVAAKEFGALPSRQERHSYLQHRIAAAVALLFTAAFCVDRFANENEESNAVVAVEPVHEVLSCALEHLKLSVLPSDNSDSTVLEADASRWFEARELEDATKILYAELAACIAQQKVHAHQKNKLI